jgi:hypothetical protein
LEDEKGPRLPDHEITQYFNEMLARLEELLYHELSRTAHKKVELVGVDFLRSKEVKGKSLDEIISSCIGEIIAWGIAERMGYSVHGHGIVLRFEIEGCIHMRKEIKLKNLGAVPYMCPLANMIGDRIIEILNYEIVHVANIEVDEEHRKCVVKYAAFESAQKIGQVSDWLSI